MGRKAGRFMMDFGEEVKTQWAFEPWNLRCRFTHHTHTLTPHTPPTECAPRMCWEAQRLLQGSLDSTTKAGGKVPSEPLCLA